MTSKIYTKEGKELFTYRIKFCWTPKIIEYLAESKDECEALFLENNQDLEAVDLEIIKHDASKQDSEVEDE